MAFILFISLQFGRAGWGHVISAPFKLKGLEDSVINIWLMSTRRWDSGWDTDVLILIRVLSFLKVWWFGSQGEYQVVQAAVIFFLCAALKVTVSLFPRSQALPDSKRENTDAPPAPHLNEHVSTPHHNKSLKDGIHIIVIIFGKHTLPYPKISIYNNEDRRKSHIWKRSKSETTNSGPTPYTMSWGQEQQGPSSWVSFLRLSVLQPLAAPTTVLLERGLGSKSLSLTARSLSLFFFCLFVC